MALRSATRALALHASLAALAVAAPLDSFLAPVAGLVALNADLVSPVNETDAGACAARCLAFGPACISINVCTTADAGQIECGISGFNISYETTGAASCTWYRRITPRNDSPAVQAVPWRLQLPVGGVQLTGGPLAEAFDVNVDEYLSVRDPQDMLHFFAVRAGDADPPGVCWGWGGWIRGSEAGNFLMGAGSALQWREDVLLRANTEAVVAGIGKYAQPNGWVFAFPEDQIGFDNLPDYCAGWVTRGLLDAAGAGVPGALALARGQISLFNNHSALPSFLPPNGGPNPVQPFPAGFNNVTNGGYGQASGHMIYIQYQGMIKHTLMALSPAGTQADVDIVADLYQEDWWLQALIDKDPFHAVWHRQFFSHNYEITAYEAFLDMYVLTGNGTYLQAMLNAWQMLRDHWVHIGGSFAINEGSYYPPDSYYLGFTGRVVAAPHGHTTHGAEAAAEGADPYFHSHCMTNPVAEEGAEEEPPHHHHHVSPLQRMKAAAMAPAPLALGQVAGPNDGDPPTGELCGSVFWALFNQRFHRLFPDNETFVGEIERSLLNVGVAAQGRPGSGGEGPGGTGIRYFANLHKAKQFPSMHASCCEGQGTRLFGTIPQFLFTLPPAPSAPAALRSGAAPHTAAPGTAGVAAGVFVDIYSPSSIAVTLPGGGVANVSVQTLWPYSGAVNISVTLQAAAAFDLTLRIPAWAAAPAVPVTVGGVVWPAAGAPGSYLHIAQAAWPSGTTAVSATFPMALTAHNYSGASQLPPFTRAGYLYGPTLLAAQGPWDGGVDAVVMPAGLDPLDPAAWLVPAGDGNALHFNVTAGGAPTGFSFRPYFEIQDADATFDVYPCF